MAKVIVKEVVNKSLVVETFNMKAESNGHNIVVYYKPGLSPKYDELFNISKEMLPQLIDVLQTMQKELEK